VSKTNAVWVTGASSGIGKALAIKFAQNDYHVITSARRIDEIKKYVTEFDLSEKIKIIKNDISDFSDLHSKYSELNNNFNINILINNAGITSFKPFLENTIDEIDQIIKTNLLGSIYTTHLVLPEMVKNNSGIIINILSVAAKKIFTNSSIYAASKAGLDLFAQVLREEVRSKNIKIANIFPGATSTEIWHKSVLEKHSIKMMNPKNLADFIFNIIQNDSNILPEEIVVRPITGDF
jgi:short-subunit dehydrogenase